MSADVAAFVDTNVLVYAVSNDEPEKQRLAREIVARGSYGGVTVENPFAVTPR